MLPGMGILADLTNVRNSKANPVIALPRILSMILG